MFRVSGCTSLQRQGRCEADKVGDLQRKERSQRELLSLDGYALPTLPRQSCMFMHVCSFICWLVTRLWLFW